MRARKNRFPSAIPTRNIVQSKVYFKSETSFFTPSWLTQSQAKGFGRWLELTADLALLGINAKGLLLLMF